MKRVCVSMVMTLVVLAQLASGIPPYVDGTDYATAAADMREEAGAARTFAGIAADNAQSSYDMMDDAKYQCEFWRWACQDAGIPLPIDGDGYYLAGLEFEYDGDQDWNAGLDDLQGEVSSNSKWRWGDIYLTEPSYYLAYIAFWESRNFAIAAGAHFGSAVEDYDAALEPFELAACAYENAYYYGLMGY